eukprot:scaffold56752_cov66-Phaeocystis_antarctica.AAC.3
MAARATRPNTGCRTHPSLPRILPAWLALRQFASFAHAIDCLMLRMRLSVDRAVAVPSVCTFPSSIWTPRAT